MWLMDPTWAKRQVPKSRFPNVSFYELLGSTKLPHKAVFGYCLLLLDRHYYSFAVCCLGIPVSVPSKLIQIQSLVGENGERYYGKNARIHH